MRLVFCGSLPSVGRLNKKVGYFYICLTEGAPSLTQGGLLFVNLIWHVLAGILLLVPKYVIVDYKMATIVPTTTVKLILLCKILFSH